MRILVLTFYYRPDLSAGSFRASALVEDLRRLAPPGSHIDVITTLPNRYATFSAEAPEHEESEGTSVRRISIGAHRSGMIDQSRAFMRFRKGALEAVAGRKYDIVFATSSRLMTASLGADAARRTGAELYLDIRDIFADTMKEVLAPPLSWGLSPVLSALEKRTIRAAAKVNLVSPGFGQYFTDRYPRTEFSFFTNGIDDEFVAAAPAQPRSATRTDKRIDVVYAGNLGEGQGLHAIVPRLAKRLEDRVRFIIVGDGGRRAALEGELAAHNVTNVELRPPVNRRDLIDTYRSADVLFLHLNDFKAFEKVLPSKVFEYAAMGAPIWAGLGGYSAGFVRSEISNSAVFAPCDLGGALKAFDSLRLQVEPRSDFVARFGRAAISRAMAADILSIAR